MKNYNLFFKQHDLYHCGYQTMSLIMFENRFQEAIQKYESLKATVKNKDFIDGLEHAYLMYNDAINSENV